MPSGEWRFTGTDFEQAFTGTGSFRFRRPEDFRRESNHTGWMIEGKPVQEFLAEFDDPKIRAELYAVVETVIQMLSAATQRSHHAVPTAILGDAIRKAREAQGRANAHQPPEFHVGPFVWALVPKEKVSRHELLIAVSLGGVIYTHQVDGEPRRIIPIEGEVL